jgi:hypothetical protein
MIQDHSRLRKTSTAGLVVAATVLVVVMVSAFAGVFDRDLPTAVSTVKTGTRPVADISLPRPVRPAFVPFNPPPLSEKAAVWRWAPVRQSVAARRKPRASGAVVAHLGTRTPEGTVNIVSVLGARVDGRRRLWVHVRLPVLPNGLTGWIPRETLGGYGFVRTRLLIDLEAQRMTLYRSHAAIFNADIGVGKASSPTPRGTFYIRDRVTDFDSPFYGPVAFGTSARSRTLTDWPGGGFIGIHGTNQPGLLPGAISHGCIRLTNRAITDLARLMPVGTPVTIR